MKQPQDPSKVIRKVGRPKGAPSVPRRLMKVAERMSERGNIFPDEALVAMRTGNADCMLCKGSGFITVEERLLDSRIAIPKAYVEQADGKMREEEVDYDTQCKCSACRGKGHLYLMANERIQVEQILATYVFPKIKQIEIDQKQSKQLPQVNWLTSIRDPEVLQAKIIEAQAAMSGDAHTEDDDDSIVGDAIRPD